MQPETYSFIIFKFEFDNYTVWEMRKFKCFILVVLFTYTVIHNSNAQVVTDTLGNTIVEISVAIDSSNFQGGFSSGPWDLHWGPDDKLWYTNQKELCTYDPATQIIDTILSLASGYIMGVTTHNDFLNNPYVYLTVDTAYYYGGGQLIEFYKYDYSLTGDSLYNPQFILKWNHGGEHSGGRVVYGNDDKLYVSTAEYFIQLDTLFNNSGKVLRINNDGTVPLDNPRADYTFTYGHRNPQGIVQVPNGNLFVSEYGAQWDELNLIQANGYYGWIVFDGVSCLNVPDTCAYYDTLTVFPIDYGMNPPSGIDYYNHPAIPEFNGLIQAVTGFLKQGIIAYSMNAQFDSVLQKSYYLTQEYGRVRDVCAASDGSVYFIAYDRQVPDIRRIQNPLFSSTAEMQSSGNFNLYPNPANEILNYYVNKSDNFTLTLNDISGRKVFSEIFYESSGSIDISRLKSGCYFAEFKLSSGHKFVKKLIIE